MKKSLLFLFAILLCLLISGQALAENSGVIALALKVKGDVKLTRDKNITPLSFGKTLNHGDVIVTGEGSLVTILFVDDRSIAKLEANTNATIEGKKTPDGSIAKRISLEIGNIYAKITKQRGTFEVATPTSVASVKGTEFYIVVGSNGSTYVVTIEGLVSLLNRISGQVIEVGISQRGDVDAEGNMNLEDVVEEDLPEDPDPEPAGAAPLKTIEIEYLDDNDRLRTITIQYRDTDQEQE